MRSARGIVFATIITLSAFSAITYTACKKDKCKDVNCQNGGTCSSGVCNCPANYSGPHCEVAGPCANVVCQNGGTCDNGLCACPTGYEGTYCETEVRAKFLKTWAASDTNSFNNNPVTLYHPVVLSSASLMQVKISVMANGFFAHDVIGTVSGDSILIAGQQPDAGTNSYSISGNAVLINDTLYWHYTVVTAGTVNYVGTWR